MHCRRIVALDKDRIVAVTNEKRTQFVGRNARKYRRVGDFVAVQMQNGQNGTVPVRVQELVRMPGRRQRSGFGFPITDDTRDD